MTVSDIGIVISRGVVAGVLLSAAVAKLRDPAAVRAALSHSGLPVSLDHTLPLVEGFTALGLLMETRTVWAAGVACALLLAFSLFVVVQLARHSDAPCPCFGSTSAARPVRATTLARNLLLLALAVVATGASHGYRWLTWVAAVLVVGALSMFAIADSRHDPTRH